VLEAVLLERVGGGAGRELVGAIIAGASPRLGAPARALAAGWLAAVPSRTVFGRGGGSGGGGGGRAGVRAGQIARGGRDPKP
jgi:hypothetical protein